MYKLEWDTFDSHEGSGTWVNGTASLDAYVGHHVSSAWTIESCEPYNHNVTMYSVLQETYLSRFQALVRALANLTQPDAIIKGLTDGKCYIPNISGIQKLKVELWTSDPCSEGDQEGPLSPPYYFSASGYYPNKQVDTGDYNLVLSCWATSEGDPDWNYRADIDADKKIWLGEVNKLIDHFGNTTTYQYGDLHNLYVTFQYSNGTFISEVRADNNGCVTIPTNAGKLIVKHDSGGTKTEVEAMILFYK